MTGTAGAVRYNTVLTCPVYGPSRPKSLNSTIIGAHLTPSADLSPYTYPVVPPGTVKFRAAFCKLSLGTQNRDKRLLSSTNQRLGLPILSRAQKNAVLYLRFVRRQCCCP